MTSVQRDAPTPVEQRLRRQLRGTRLFAAYVPLALARRSEPRMLARAQLPAGVQSLPARAGDIPGHWLIPAHCPLPAILLFFHGGGFVFQMSPQHLELLGILASRVGARALAIDYRLAPEHPFPAALDDCLAAYRWLLRQNIAPEQIALVGDSAGGNLALVTAMALRDHGEPLPAAVVCFSPVTDLADPHSRERAKHDLLLHPKAVVRFNQSYLAGHDPRDPLVSPVYGDWHGLPPLLIFAGEEEMLRSDAERAVALAQAAGVDARLSLYPRMWHDWPLFLDLPQAVQALDEAAAFLRVHLAPAQVPAAPR